MTERTYPCTVWILTPSYKPKAVILVRPYPLTTWEKSFSIAEGGKSIRLSSASPTKQAAIAAGRAKLEHAAAELGKRMALLAKRRAVLDKAEKEPS